VLSPALDEPVAAAAVEALVPRMKTWIDDVTLLQDAMAELLLPSAPAPAPGAVEAPPATLAPAPGAPAPPAPPIPPKNAPVGQPPKGAAPVKGG
jgi:hypothetical protein